MTTDHVYFPEPNSGRCVANGDEPLCTLSADQHQPAAAAPRLSEDEIGEIQARVDAAAPGPWQAKSTHGGPYRDDLGRAQAGFWIPELESLGDGECSAMLEDDAQFAAHARLDIPRLLADLARTRAEAATLRKALVQFQDRKGHFNFNATPCDANWFGSEKNAKCSPWCKKARKALAAPHSEPQPAAPVAPRGVACPKCGGDAFASFDVIVGRGCGHVIGATTPPDHQAGESDGE
jgi:hypothetical protein